MLASRGILGAAVALSHGAGLTMAKAGAARVLAGMRPRNMSTLSGTVVDKSLGLTDDQKMLLGMAEDFAENEVAPHASEWDEGHIMPIHVFKKAGELGFGGMYVKEDVGGTGLTRLDTSVVLEALSTADVGVAAFVSIHNMCNGMIDIFGNEEQRHKWCPVLSKMDGVLASYCLTEPGSGSDAASLQTRAVRDGDHYVLNGSKAFISGGGESQVYLIMARTGDKSAKGISCFIVEKGTPGLSFGANERKMGWNSQATRSVIMEDCRVPAENLLGGEGNGFKIAMSGLDGGRVNIASCSLGGADASLAAAINYTKDRRQFGKSISDFQHTQFKLADMATRLHTSRLAVRQAARAIDENDPLKTQYCAMAKVFATEQCMRLVSDALQLHGGYGYLKDYPVERFFRDLRVHEILEGTSQVMRMIISRGLISH